MALRTWVVIGVALLLSGAPAQALEAGRLEEMKQALAGFRAIGDAKAVAGEPLGISAPESRKLLSVLCRAGEAEKLSDLPTDRYDDTIGYIIVVGRVMGVVSDAADRSGSQQQITNDVRELGDCWDAALWSGRAALVIADRMARKDPEILKDPKSRAALAKLHQSVGLTLEGTLDSFRLAGIGTAWCEARLRPISAVAEVAGRSFPREQKLQLRKAIDLAAACGPAAKAGLQPAHRSLAP